MESLKIPPEADNVRFLNRVKDSISKSQHCPGDILLAGVSRQRNLLMIVLDSVQWSPTLAADCNHLGT